MGSLTSDDIERLADALAERLNRRPDYLDARGLAELLGVSPDVVYERADELGACRLGTRVIFSVDEAVRRMRREPDSVGTPVSRRPTARRRPRSTVELLPIDGGRR